MSQSSPQRSLGFIGATGVGVGAIVGGGILALAGVAFATTGPSAILAFALNGVVALVTVASLAELAARFPYSGGTYTYATSRPSSMRLASRSFSFPSSSSWYACSGASRRRGWRPG